MLERQRVMNFRSKAMEGGNRMKVVMKTKGCGKYRTPEYDNM